MYISQGNHKLRLKNVYERENYILKIAKMTITDHTFFLKDYGHLSFQLWSSSDDRNYSYGHQLYPREFTLQGL